MISQNISKSLVLDDLDKRVLLIVIYLSLKVIF